jgi:transposase
LIRFDIQQARDSWAIATASVAHRRLLFIDESGAKTNMTRLYGRAPRGRRVNDYVPNGRWETTTMIAAVGRNGPQAAWVLDGPMDGEAILVWAEQVLAPTLEPSDIVVMDNLSVHKNGEARSVIEATGATIWDLPPYSPDLNPIEKMWSKIKALLRKAKAREPETLGQAIGHALEKVSHKDIRNWFASCGYSLI